MYRVEIDKYPKEYGLTLHYVISWNTLPEKVDCSCWYAVDVTHDKLLEWCK